MLKQRVLTALVLLAILLPALFYPSPLPFAIVVLVLMAAGAWEWGRMNGWGQVGALALGAVCVLLCAVSAQLGWLERPLTHVWVIGGALWVLGSAAAYALYLFFSGEFVQRIGSLRLVGLASTVASVCCIVHFLLLNPLGAARVAEPVLWLSLLNATLCTAVPVLLVMLGVERIGASLAAQVGMIGPLSTIAMSVVLLGEPFTPGLAAGTVLVVAGIALFSRAGRRVG